MHWESQKIKLKIKKSSRKIQSLENVSKTTKLIKKLLAKPELYKLCFEQWCPSFIIS